MSAALTDGRRFRVLAVVDDYSRECPALVADTSLSGHREARELDAVIARRGRPAMVVSDNGTELTSMAILSWCQSTGVEWHNIAPGKPMQNARGGLGPVAAHRSPSRASTGASGTSC
ncbi:integrase-like protein [Pseudoroseicyclus aestuarii]|uniref:Integrase-like protein n=1 Tax=Pseudoroseicyclus aestuarii TaxID=1795041 RepID=A0A318SRU8_9RHOB|nr:integrase-like protein [Pseudoroseicyclus aestuarii]PYE80849.1 integrase-like protein [Pseudoroseicyclus aestuarii]